jgi:hypothetical protein
MGYGESEAYRAGLYRSDEGYSYYPPDDEEDDMAVGCNNMVDFDGEQYVCGTLIESIASCIFCDDCTAHVEADARRSEA